MEHFKVLEMFHIVCALFPMSLNLSSKIDFIFTMIVFWRKLSIIFEDIQSLDL